MWAYRNNVGCGAVCAGGASDNPAGRVGGWRRLRDGAEE
jgi:hypothetical protein